VLHWETRGESGEYYLATELIECNWKEQGVFKSKSVFEYVTEVLYPNNLSPIQQFRAGIQQGKIDKQKFYSNKFTYERWNVINHIFIQIVLALKWLHEQNVAHLDISLENLMIAGGSGNSPQVKVIDFGVAQEYSKVKNPQYNQWPGKPQYVAPEVAKASEPEKIYYDPYLADVWTLGVCLWIMIFKQYPFTDASGTVLDRKILDTDHGDYLYKAMEENYLLPMITEEAFDVFNKIFQPAAKRITMKGLAEHKFCLKKQQDDPEEKQP